MYNLERTPPLRVTGQLQCGRRAGAHRLRRAGRVDDPVADAQARAVPDGVGDRALGPAGRAQHQLSQFRADSGVAAVLRDARVPALGCLGAGQFNKGAYMHMSRNKHMSTDTKRV